MNKFRVIPLPTEIAQAMRRDLRDEYGNTLVAETSVGGAEPCRHCLKRAVPGEKLLLFAHSPFAASGPYKEVGPIFVHSHACRRYERSDAFPEDFKRAPVVLRGYDERQTIAMAELVEPAAVERRIEAMLQSPEVAFIQVRSWTYGCYLCRVVRPG